MQQGGRHPATAGPSTVHASWTTMTSYSYNSQDIIAVVACCRHVGLRGSYTRFPFGQSVLVLVRGVCSGGRSLQSLSNDREGCSKWWCRPTLLSPHDPNACGARQVHGAMRLDTAAMSFLAQPVHSRETGWCSKTFQLRCFISCRFVSVSVNHNNNLMDPCIRLAGWLRAAWFASPVA